jgi:phosphate:Na+ symporter
MSSMASTTLQYGAILTGLGGGLALFLYGMRKMTDALKIVAGGGMKDLLGRLTTNRFTGAVAGTLVTAVIQSSSVTTVLIVGFITADLMSFSQSIGVIIGANIGTTITAQIIAFKVTKYALLLIGVGFLMEIMAKNRKVRHYGIVLMGLGLIFFGMELMSDATRPLRTYQPFIDLMQEMKNPIQGILIGLLFTTLVQSSSATTGIVIVLAGQGFITLEAGIALVLGANIGTCITAPLSAIGKPREAIQAATAHIIFNVLGVLLWVAFIPQLADVARSISPSSPELQGAARMAADSPRQIANAHTLFNVGNALVFIWFITPLARLVERIVPKRPEPKTVRIRAQYLDELFLEQPAEGDLRLHRRRQLHREHR